MKGITPFRIAVCMWGVFMAGILIFKAQPPNPIYIEVPTPTTQIVYQTETVEVGQKAYYSDIAASISDDERELLAKVTYLEAGNQSMTGQRAVVEVVLNRVMNDKFPNMIEEVIYQPGQFATSSRLSTATPGDEQYQAVDLTLETSIPILEPHVLFFAKGIPNWQTKYEKIGDHYFGCWR